MINNTNQPHDPAQFSHVIKHCAHLEETHQARNRFYNEIIEAFMMRWDEGSQMRNDKRDLNITISPSARNQVLGAVRLMIATDPTFTVKDRGQATGRSSMLENAAEELFKAAGRISNNPIHFDMILSGILFSEVHAGINKTADLVMEAQGSSKAAIRRLKEAEATSPYMIETWDPREGYPEFDKLGMRAFYRKTKATNHQLVERYGDGAITVIGADYNPYQVQDVHIYNDLDRQWVWVGSNMDQPILKEDREEDFIPISASIIEGSTIFDKEEDRRQPFLYAMLKSGIWNRQNLMLTVIYDMIFKLGVSPQLVFEADHEDARPSIDWSTSKVGIIKIIRGKQSLQGLEFNKLDPALMTGWQLADDIGTESTIYKQALGQALTGSNATFSLQSLLSQAGRLPLVWPQRKLSWQIADIAKLMLRWIKTDGSVSGEAYERAITELKPAEIPEYFNMESHLEIDMPQDLNMMANLAVAVTMGERPLTSKRYARDKFLRINDSDQMDRDIWNESMSDAMFTTEIRKIMDAQALETEQARMQAQPQTQQQQIPQDQRPQPNMQNDPIIQQLMNMGTPPEIIDAVASGQMDPRQAITMMNMQQGQQPMGGPMGGSNGGMIP